MNSAVVSEPLRRLARAFVGEAQSLPPDRRERYAADLHRYVLRVLGSRFEPAVVADELHVAELLKSRLAHEGRHDDAIRMATLLRKLSASQTLSREWATLFLLHRLAGTPSQLAYQASTAPLTGRGAAAFHSEGLARVHDAGTTPAAGSAAQASEAAAAARVRRMQAGGGGGGLGTAAAGRPRGRTEWGAGAGATADGGGGGAAEEAAPPPPRPGFAEYKQVVNTSFDVGEPALLRDMIYVLQGIDGKHVRYSRRADGFVVDAAVGVPRATRHLCHTLAELGWLFRRVRHFVSEGLDNLQLGRVAQGLCASLQAELAEYYRLIAALEAQQSAARGAGGSLTLRRLLVWSFEPRQRFCTMAVLVDVATQPAGAAGLKGGALASAIHAQSRHGDPAVRSFIEGVVQRMSVPIFEGVRRWLYEGELDDPQSEFFVAARRAVPVARLWTDKYALRESMLPSFIPLKLAREVLVTGKSINFLRACCNNEEWVRAFAQGGRAQSQAVELSSSDAAAAAGEGAAEWGTAAGAAARGGAEQGGGGSSYSADVLGLAFGSLQKLGTVVHAAAAKVNRRLVTVIMEQYDFAEHCRALQSYLLLAQGDFIQQLMAGVGDELGKAAPDISRSVLAGKLEQAIRSSSAATESANILDRLDVQLLAPSPGDTGWDIFTLKYHLDSPLTTVILPAAMEGYLRLFNFLWRLKRVESALNRTWAQNHIFCRGRGVGGERSLHHRVLTSRRFAADVRRCDQLRIRMLAFVDNLQYYISAEVLGTAWITLLDEARQAKDLDALIDAHNRYLDSMLDGCLLGRALDRQAERQAAASDRQSQPPKKRSVAPLFSKLTQIFSVILRFHDAQDGLHERINAEVARWEQRKADLEEEGSGWGIDGEMEAEEEAHAPDGGDAVLSRVARDFDVLFRMFYKELHEHDELQFLYFRLDFNDFYEHSKHAAAGEIGEVYGSTAGM